MPGKTTPQLEPRGSTQRAGRVGRPGEGWEDAGGASAETEDEDAADRGSTKLARGGRLPERAALRPRPRRGRASFSRGSRASQRVAHEVHRQRQAEQGESRGSERPPDPRMSSFLASAIWPQLFLSTPPPERSDDLALDGGHEAQAEVDDDEVGHVGKNVPNRCAASELEGACSLHVLELPDLLHPCRTRRHSVTQLVRPITSTMLNSPRAQVCEKLSLYRAATGLPATKARASMSSR